MNTFNFKRLGSGYGRNKPQPPENSNLQDCFDGNFGQDDFGQDDGNNNPDNSGDDGDDNDDLGLFALDALVNVINNNRDLSEFYLVGSDNIQSCNVEKFDDIYSSPLYPGSDTTVFDLIIVLELIKTTIKLGDVNESVILGLLASFLPPDNAIKVFLSQTSSSIYHFQKLINKSREGIHKSSIHKIPICNNCKKTPFCGSFRLLPRCRKCRTLKDLKSPNQIYIYYLPLKDRLLQLLVSDLRNLFHYPDLRNKGNEDYIEDTFDGTNWKSFDNLMDRNKNEKLIGLQWCWDGADSFTFSGKSFWPGCISILNFPLDLRSKLHVGMHVISLCDGNLCCCVYLLFT